MASRNRRLRSTSGALWLIALGLTQANAATPHAGESGSWPLLQKYCAECHNSEDWAGGVAFDVLEPDSIAAEGEVWEKTVRKLKGQLMPPPGNAQPSATERAELSHFLETRLDSAASARGPSPGRVALHRLNRVEYARQVEALVGIRVDPEEVLPPDAESHGFYNIADALQVSPAFLEQYISAAREISILAVGASKPAPGQAVYSVPLEVNHNRHVAGLPLGTRGGLAVEHQFPADGKYTVNLRISSIGGSLLRSYPTGWLEHRHELVVFVDGVPLFKRALGGEEDLRAVDQQQTAAVTEIQNRFRNLSFEIKGGRRSIAAGFIARSRAESDDLLQPLVPGVGADDVPIITEMELVGPFEAARAQDTASRRKIFSCYPRAGEASRVCAEQIVRRLATQAFRRPVSQGEVDRLLFFFAEGEKGGGFDDGIQRALMAMLSSTHFLYRVEDPASIASNGSGAYPLSDIELASRLSFFLWAEGPDEALMRLAQAGRLSRPAQLNRQIDRMLADPRARSLVTGFASQWLGMKNLVAVDPDSRVFPGFDEDLRAAFRMELELFVGSVLLSRRPVTDLVTADHTFLNERLARHYGIRGVTGERFRQETLTDSRRWGLLGKGGILLQTSYPNRTSPVLRGAWILENLLGAPPAAPPPGVETDLDSSVAASASLTIRSRLESHRKEASCNQCHGVIDPLGLALENFDAVGAWRDIDRDARQPIDATGQLADGHPVNGPSDLREALHSQAEQFTTVFTEKLMTYALGRTVNHLDMPVVRAIVRNASRNGMRFDAIVKGIVTTDAFRLRDASSDSHPEATPPALARH